jgi:predicted TIM-barrel fold metal-dependent hydrolase
MQITDAQVHIWGSGTPSGDHRQTPVFTVEELLAEMDEAGVHAAVIHPPVSWDPDANAIAEAAAAKHPDRFAILGQVPLDTPDTSRPLLKGWRDRPGQCGLRYPLVRADQQSWPFDGTLDWLWPAAEDGRPPRRHHGLALPAGIRGHRRTPPAPAADHRPLRPDPAREGRGRLRQPRCRLRPRALPNVALKATGAPGYSREAYPFRDIHDGLHRLYDAFGPDRFFWGTDITRMPCSWRQCITLFTEELPWLRGPQMERVMGGAIRDWIGWGR